MPRCEFEYELNSWAMAISRRKRVSEGKRRRHAWAREEQSMRRRFVLCLAAFLFLALATFVSLWFATRPVHRVNLVNAQKIEKGMELEEVEAILGVPAGDYSTRPVWYFHAPISPIHRIPA
jgi:hypothetical protein